MGQKGFKKFSLEGHQVVTRGLSRDNQGVSGGSARGQPGVSQESPRVSQGSLVYFHTTNNYIQILCSSRSLEIVEIDTKARKFFDFGLKNFLGA